MDIKQKIRVALGLEESNVKLEWQAKLTDGTIVVSSKDELDAGCDISVLTEDGTTMPLPAGEYETEDGVAFTVEDEGIVAEIVTEESEEETEEEAPETEEVEASEEPRMPKKVKESREMEFNSDEFKAELLGEVKTLVNDLVAEALTKVVEENEKVKGKVEELSKTPAVAPLQVKKNFAKSQFNAKPYNAMSAKERYWFNLSN